ncbi:MULTISPECIES: monofunctional biosynthetic peptidoglycan transglycosylase [unclassified Roseitalea]|uniref:monofunctional biosynthetic peptidoglycan transglycosylase n=1 Tax=unclassified Roseitalea TaxID=2639107 RepID=UPI00273F8E95|nr:MULTISPECIES: monofunctional biosynthetic peptidoglycan transglycosylase [unclassified Roseitalea]
MKRSRRRWFLRRWVLIPLVVLFAIALTPFVLALLYRVEDVRPVSTLMLSRALAGEPVERRWVEFDEIAPSLYQSVMMSEDGQFCAHDGIDWAALNMVISDALDGERTRGASTITMQTAKNLFLWNDRSYVRKALEVPLALWIDFVLPKKRIMEIYLNIAEWGPQGQFGVQVAAEHHFDREPSDITAMQAALLATTLPNPHMRDPARPSAHHREVAGVIARRARQSGAYIGCLSQ